MGIPEVMFNDLVDAGVKDFEKAKRDADRLGDLSSILRMVNKYASNHWSHAVVQGGQIVSLVTMQMGDYEHKRVLSVDWLGSGVKGGGTAAVLSWLLLEPDVIVLNSIDNANCFYE